jgi:hypothetical protein
VAAKARPILLLGFALLVAAGWLWLSHRDDPGSATHDPGGAGSGPAAGGTRRTGRLEPGPGRRGRVRADGLAERPSSRARPAPSAER